MSFFSGAASASLIRYVPGTVTPPVQTDFNAPEIPTDLVEGNTTPDSTYLRWRAVNDDVFTTGYNIYQNGVLKNTVVDNEGKVTGLTQGSYTFTVSAFDLAGNESAQSAGLLITIPAPVADATDSIITAKGQLALDSTYIDLDGANIREENDTKYLTRWVDRSPSGNDAVQTDIDLQMEVLTEFKHILPDGYDDVMMMEQDFTLDSVTGGFSIYLCLEKFFSGISVVLARRGAVGTGGGCYFIKNGDFYELRFATASNYLMIFGGMTLADIDGNKVYEIHHNGAGSATLLINGVEKSTIAVNNESWTFGRLSSAYDGDYFQGVYKGIFSFSSVLTAGEKTTMRDALMLRYNV